MKATWCVSDTPLVSGRSAVVTGTGGLGFQNALALARAGWSVTIAGRNPAKGETAVARINASGPNLRVRYAQLDLASLASIEAFCTGLKGDRQSLDLLKAISADDENRTEVANRPHIDGSTASINLKPACDR